MRAPMKSCCGQLKVEGAHRATTPPSLTKRGTSLLGWLLPTTMLALMPKCPVCVAAYVAMFTGFGLSVAVATWLRSGMIALCVGLLMWMAWRLVRRLVLHGYTTPE